MENIPSPQGGLRPCSKCGNLVEPGNKFCEVCGSKIEELPICKNCGAQFIAPVKFCELCGTPVAPGEKPPTVEPDDIPSQPGPAPVQPAKKPGPVTIPKVSGIPKKPEKKQVEEPVPDLEDVVKKAVPVSVPGNLGLPKIQKKQVEEPGPAPVRTPPPAKPASAITPDPLSAAFSGLSDDPARSAPSKPSMNKALIRGAVVLLLILILVAGAYFIGMPMLKGSSQKTMVTAAPVTTITTASPAVTEQPAKTTVPTPLPTTRGYSLIPGPTQNMPANQAMVFQVDKDPVDAKVTALFAGGPGLTSLREAEVRVTRPDGQVLTAYIRPAQGISEVTLQGSKATDRVEVIANLYSGQKYTVIDQLAVYRMR